MTEFRLLGPVEVLVAGRPLGVGTAKHRGVLACNVLYAHLSWIRRLLLDSYVRYPEHLGDTRHVAGDPAGATARQVAIELLDDRDRTAAARVHAKLDAVNLATRTTSNPATTGTGQPTMSPC